MKTLRKVKNWEYIIDELHGVTAFINVETNEQTLWNIGFEAQEELEEIKKMSDKEFTEYCNTNINSLLIEDVKNLTE